VNAVAYLRNARKGKAYRRVGGAFVLVHAKRTSTCRTVATKLLEREGRICLTFSICS
jgi:hypothetical protein